MLILTIIWRAQLANNIVDATTAEEYDLVTHYSFAVLGDSHKFVLRASVWKGYPVRRLHMTITHAKSRTAPALGAPGKLS